MLGTVLQGCVHLFPELSSVCVHAWRFGLCVEVCASTFKRLFFSHCRIGIHSLSKTTARQWGCCHDQRVRPRKHMIWDTWHAVSPIRTYRAKIMISKKFKSTHKLTRRQQVTNLLKRPNKYAICQRNHGAVTYSWKVDLCISWELFGASDVTIV